MHAEKLHVAQKDRISTEMYLKTIHLLQQENGEARQVDLSHELDVTKSSVSEMLKKLAEEGYVSYQSFSPVKLTEKGLRKAKNVLGKYETVARFLKDVLNVDAEKVHDEACNLEHAFSDESAKKLEQLMKRLKV